jgi:hypothetical protein
VEGWEVARGAARGVARAVAMAAARGVARGVAMAAAMGGAREDAKVAAEMDSEAAGVEKQAEYAAAILEETLEGFLEVMDYSAVNLVLAEGATARA